MNGLAKKKKLKSLNTIFSQKQVNQLKGYYKSFNDWKKNNGGENRNY